MLKNESMNLLVSNCVPENKTYSKSNNLEVRAVIAVIIQVTENRKVWETIFDEFKSDSNINLAEVFDKMDEMKLKQKRKGR